MASYDRQFEIVMPTFDRVMRMPVEVSDPLLVLPTSTSPLALIDGELLQFNATGKWARATDATKPSYFCLDERGDTNVQASKRLTAVVGPSMFIDTLVFDTALTTLGAELGQGNVTVGGGTRSGLVAASTNFVLGYIVKTAAVNGGGRIRVHVTGL